MTLKVRILLLGLLLFGIASVAAAQQDFVAGPLTVAAAACPVSPGMESSSTSALTLGTMNAGGATFTIGASAFSGTVSFFGSADGAVTWQPLNVFPSNSTTPVTTATAAGVWQVNVAAYTNVCMVFTTATSGTVTATIRKATVSARAGGGGGGAAPAGATNSIQTNNGSGGFTGIGCLGGTNPLISCTQAANGNDTVNASRFTDTTPTGTFLNFMNAAKNATLFSVDVLGNVTGNSFQTNGAGAGYFQCSNGNGTLPTLVTGAAQISCPSGAITNYQMLLPTAAGTGCLNGANAANVVTLTFASCGGLSGLTTGFIPKAGSSTSIVNSLCDEGITTANVLTCTDTGGAAFTGTRVTAGSAPPTVAGSGIVSSGETTGQTGAVGVDAWVADSVNHCYAAIFNNVNLGCAKTVSNSTPTPVSSTTCGACPISNPTINVDQNMIQLSTNTGYFNVIGQSFYIQGSGNYSTTAASAPALTYEIKLCTVSLCASGTVVDLFDITTTALSATALTNATWTLTGLCVTKVTGATGNLICKGSPGLTLDTGASIVTPDSTFADTNTTASANIDLTQALFIDFSVAQSVAGASNSYTQTLGVIR